MPGIGSKASTHPSEGTQTRQEIAAENHVAHMRGRCVALVWPSWSEAANEDVHQDSRPILNTAGLDERVPVGNSADLSDLLSVNSPERVPAADVSCPEDDKAGNGNDPRAVPAGLAPFRRYFSARLGDRQTLLHSLSSELVALMAEIVRIEGPIHRDELDRVVAGLYQARVAGQVKDLLDTARGSGSRGHQFFERGEFVWPAGMEKPPIRWRGGDDAVTDPALICPEEVAEAAIWLTRNQFGIPLDDLPAATLHALGFKRIGTQLAGLGAAGVQLALKARRIVADPAGFMVAPTDSEGSTNR